MFIFIYLFDVAIDYLKFHLLQIVSVISIFLLLIFQ